MDKLKGLNKVEVVIGIIVLILLIVGIYAAFYREASSPTAVESEQNTEENEEVNGGSNVPPAKTGTPRSSGGSTNKTIPPQNFNSTAIFPSAQLIADGRAQDSTIGTYCWLPIGICSDSFITNLDGVDPLIVEKNLSIKLKLNTNTTPISVKAILRKPVDSLEEYINNKSKLVVENIQLSPNKETSFQLNVAPGVYILTVSSDWQEGDVEFNFKVELK